MFFCVPRVFCTSEPHSRSCILPRRHATVWLRTPAGWQGVGRAPRMELCIGWAARCASLCLESWKLPAEILGYQAIPNSKPLFFFNHQWSRKMCWTNAPVDACLTLKLGYSIGQQLLWPLSRSRRNLQTTVVYNICTESTDVYSTKFNLFFCTCSLQIGKSWIPPLWIRVNLWKMQ